MTKRILSLLTLVIALFVTSGHAQSVDPNAIVQLASVSPLHGTDTLEVGQLINFRISYTNNTATAILGASTGFQIYSPSGATWDTTIMTSTGVITGGQSGMWDGGIFANHFSADGIGADTVGFGGYSIFGTGVAPGFTGEVVNIQIGPIPAEFHGGTICLDSSFYRPTNEWVWSDEGAGYYPVWDGPHCYTIFDPNATAGANLVVTPDTLNFSATAGGANPAAQAIAITSDGTPLTITSITDNQPWLSVAPTSGSTPLNPNASVDITGLAAGSYAATITINSSDAQNSPQLVVVNLTVAAAPISNLIVAPDSLAFTAQEGGSNPVAQALNITSDNLVLNFNVSDDQPWISFAPPQGQTPNSVNVSVDITGLPDGVYVGTVKIASAQAENDSVLVPVTLTITPAPSSLVVDPTSLSFNGVEGGAAPAEQNISINSDNDPLSFQISDDADWLSVSSTSGTTPFNPAVSVDQAGLADGIYTATITISSAGADNSPQTVDVTFTVTAANEPAITDVTPTSTCAPASGTKTVTLSVTAVNTTFTGSVDSIHLVGGTTIAGTNINVVDDTHLSADFEIAAGTSGAFALSVWGDGNDATLASAFTVNAPSDVIVDPGSLAFTYTIGDAVPASQSFDISAVGSAVNFTISGNDAWVDLSASAGTTPATINVTVDPTGLGAGDYTDTLTVSGGDCTTGDEIVIVTLTVNPAPAAQLHISPATLDFTATEGGSNPANRMVVVSSSDGSALDYSLANAASWLSLAPTSGTTPESVTVSVDITGLTAGVYVDTIVATSATAENDPVASVVTLTVSPDLGDNTLVVGTAPAVPGASIVVPVNFSNGCDFVGASFGLEWSSEYLTLDEVSFVGSRVEGLTTKNAVIDNDANTVYLTLAAANETEYVAPGSGLMASLTFTVSPLAVPGSYSIDIYTTGDTSTLAFTLDCGDGVVAVNPAMTAGSVVVDEQANFTCGYVVDNNGDPIEGATVELWADFPYGTAALTTTTDPTGYYSFSEFNINPFDLYAYKDGYYPDKEENLNYGCYGTLFTLNPLQDITPTFEWVNFYCGSNTYMDAPLPVGSVIEAMDPNGVLCGRWVVTEAGKYGFMPVYRDDPFSEEDEGALPGDNITFYVNGVLAEASGATVWTQNGDAFEVCLDAGNAAVKTCALEAGWNLVSWNLDTESDELEEVLASLGDNVELVMGFEEGGLTYDPALPDFSTLWTVDHFSGYWIKLTEAATLEITGMSVPTTTPIPVTAGWNLVSYLPEDTRPTEEALASLDSNLLVALGYEGAGLVYQPGEGDFNTLEELMACHGYWVKVASDDELVYDGMEMSTIKHDIVASNASAKNAQGITPTRAWVNMYSRNLTLDGQTVGAGVEVSAYSLDGTKIGSFSMKESGKFGFMPVYADDETTGEVEGVKRGEQFTLSVNGVATNETFTWAQNGDKVEISALTAKSSGSSLPKNFALNQNYPNPFNPKTRISFSLPSASEYKLAIYNITGQKVHEVSGKGIEGINELDWDATQQASGIYFYRLTAGSYSDTKKMTFLK